MYTLQNCKSARTFRRGFGPKVDKNVVLSSGLRRTFCFRCTKILSKQFSNIAKFFKPNSKFGYFWACFGLQIIFRVRAGFGSELVGPFTTLIRLRFYVQFRPNFKVNGVYFNRLAEVRATRQ